MVQKYKSINKGDLYTSTTLQAVGNEIAQTNNRVVSEFLKLDKWILTDTNLFVSVNNTNLTNSDFDFDAGDRWQIQPLADTKTGSVTFGNATVGLADTSTGVVTNLINGSTSFDTANYIQMVYLGNGQLVSALNKEIMRDESILRNITTKLPEDVSVV